MALPIKVYVIAASLATIVYLAILFRHAIATASNTVCALSPTKKCALAVMLFIAVAIGGSKTNQVNQTESTNDVNATEGPLRGIFRFPTSGEGAASPLSVTPADIARGWQPQEPHVNTNVCYTMPDGAALASNWWVRGAFEDVTRAGNLWAYSWGKVRFALTDTNEIVAVGAPMSAVPYHSRLWSVADTNGSRLVTWENFVLGRAPAADYQLPSTNYQLVSAQIEFLPNGDCITRSNEVETVWRHVNPIDFDGDGLPNDRDMSPYDWDGDFFGPDNTLPSGADEDAYCWIELRTVRDAAITFVGDGPSNLPDPDFLTCGGRTIRVTLLIGKTYDVISTEPVEIVARSDDDVTILPTGPNSFSVVWPVSISANDVPPSRPLLGAPRGGSGISMSVTPDYLNGRFSWSTNGCCQFVETGWRTFACTNTCHCKGCIRDGDFVYEGYWLGFSGIPCGCRYEPDPNTSFSLTGPRALFVNGRPGALSIAFTHGDPLVHERGQLALSVGGASGRVRLWEKANLTERATQLSWDVEDFSGHTFYVEPVSRSASVDDIEFELAWTHPGGSTETRTLHMTCAEVVQTEVDSPTAGITDGSSNPQPFAGHTNWNFNVTHSPHTDKHYAVLFRDVVNDDFSVRDFSVRMTLDVLPAEAPVGRASWFALDPTPDSGAIVSTSPRIGELRNPKVGGVYHIGSCFDGSPTNECNIVLPLAGAEMINVLHGDIARADSFLTAAKRKYTYDERTSYKFGWRWFYSHENGDYTGRPENGQTPSVWYYGQVEPYSGMGNVCTLAGTPTKLAKLSNLLTAYCCEKLQVSPFKQALSQLLGKFNGSSATISWECGQDIANGTNFYFAVSNMARQAWREMDDRVTKPWPNVLPAVNWHEKTTYLGINRNVYSPAFLNHVP